jgi:exodeoxyribonuclease VII small subunit
MSTDIFQHLTFNERSTVCLRPGPVECRGHGAILFVDGDKPEAQARNGTAYLAGTSGFDGGELIMTASPGDKISENPKDQRSAAPTFEQTLQRLDEIVHLLEEGKIGLDQALGGYEEGVGLLRKAYELLEKAERRISLLSGVDADGNPILRPMEDAASFSLEQEVAGATLVRGAAEKTAIRRGRRPADPDAP